MTSDTFKAMMDELEGYNTFKNGDRYKTIDGPISQIIPKSDDSRQIRIGRGLDMFFILPQDAEVKVGDMVKIKYPNIPGNVYPVLNLDVHHKDREDDHYGNPSLRTERQPSHYSGVAA